MGSYWIPVFIAYTIRFVSAEWPVIPWGKVPAQSLQTTTNTQISFDPLAVLVILHNPRASGSVARLYNPCEINGKILYRWPNTTMIGGALPPFKLLVDHLVSPPQSRHPVIDMYKGDRFMLDVRTDLRIPSGSFPVSHGNLWMLDLLSFKTQSAKPSNDIMIINLDTIHGRFKDKILGDNGALDTSSLPVWQFVLIFIMVCTTLLLVIGLFLSIYLLDVWALVLFSTSLLHGITSIVVSSRHMVRTNDRNAGSSRSKEDNDIHFLLHQRPGGGRVVIKGTQASLYSWQLISYSFNSSVANNLVHWAWMITGSLSAGASVICMVNMAAVMQLSYLTVLTLSSLLEIAATQIVRLIQKRVIHYGTHQALVNNEFWTQAIIRAALEVDEHLSLENVPWIKHGQLPGEMRIFQNLTELLPNIRQGKPGCIAQEDILRALEVGLETWEKGAGKLPDRLTEEIMQALTVRRQNDEKTSQQKQQRSSKLR